MDNITLISLAIVIALIVLVTLALVLRSRRAKRPAVEPSTQVALAPSPFGERLRSALGVGLDQSTWERLEEALLAADVGVEPTTRIVEHVRSAKPESLDRARSLLAEAVRRQFLDEDRSLDVDGDPAVVLIVGVNGSGKTTTIAKLAHKLTAEGRTVVLAAADTFRAAAGEQLETWADRVGVKSVVGQRGGDAASVAHDAISSARARDADLVIVDTAGRLHGKKNLMAELGKIHRVSASEATVNEILLVLDATSGQNGLTQVEQFKDAVPLTGIVLAKLDGTAKGGIVVAVENTLGVPVKYVGLGERLEDLVPFDPDGFVTSLLETP